MNLNEHKLEDGDTAIPCGLVARSFFNDRYTLTFGENKKEIKINETGIAWESDKDYKFKNTKEVPAGKDYKDIQWHDMEDGNSIII